MLTVSRFCGIHPDVTHQHARYQPGALTKVLVLGTLLDSLINCFHQEGILFLLPWCLGWTPPSSCQIIPRRTNLLFGLGSLVATGTRLTPARECQGQGWPLTLHSAIHMAQNTGRARCGGPCLWSQHTGNWGRKMQVQYQSELQGCSLSLQGWEGKRL